MTDNFLIRIFDFLFDKTKKIGLKVSVFTLIIITIVIIDKSLHFTENIHYNFKLDNTKKINEILKDSLLLSESEKNTLFDLRKKILNKEYFFDLNLNKFDYLKGSDITNNRSDEIEVKHEIIKKSFGYLFFALFWPGLFFLAYLEQLFKLFSKENRKELSIVHLLIIPFTVILCLVIYFIYYLSQVTPIFFENNIWVNYLYNFIFPPFIILLIFGGIGLGIENLITKIRAKNKR
jgi:hypothetical protein